METRIKAELKTAKSKRGQNCRGEYLSYNNYVRYTNLIDDFVILAVLGMRSCDLTRKFPDNFLISYYLLQINQPSRQRATDTMISPLCELNLTLVL